MNLPFALFCEPTLLFVLGLACSALVLLSLLAALDAGLLDEAGLFWEVLLAGYFLIYKNALVLELFNIL